MSTLPNQSAIPEPTLTLVKSGSGNSVNGSTGSSNNSGSITQGGINPSAAAMLILYEVMAMYSKITGINAQEQKTQIMAQKEMGKAEASATREAGRWAGITMIAGAAAAAALTVVGAAISVGAALYTNKYSKATSKLETENAPAKEINEIDMKTSIPDPGSGEANEAVKARAIELERGDYVNAADGTVEDKRDAISELKKDDVRYKAFRDRLDEKIGSFEKARNTYASYGQSFVQTWSTVGQSVNSIGNSANSGTQGLGQWQKAGYDANASLQRNANSMAQQTASSQADAARRAGQQQDDVVNVLKAIRQASSNV